MDTEMLTTFRTVRPMSDEEFFEFCQINDTLEFERDSHGNIILMSPTGTFTGNFHPHVLAALYNWNAESGLGEVFDSAAGFTLPNSAVRAPDMSWVEKERWARVASDKKKDRFVAICPDFVVEVRSDSDGLKYLISKMKEYIDNGTRLGWLIDRLDKKVRIFRSDGSVETVEINAVLSGEDVLPGFTLNLSKWVS
ncbi:Endonuclease, Uma2 family (restriction endonuclease fold) [Dyadobacter soli]|uniref:Endonuclease, Uma2 family (Restriction endonuclease fold) n=1 Tax=Dyadobacter soli TaxID=659014 RepID=A0A1G7BN16_9BACT|nr:Uma2 family endonuclease [Dyadobacter soli]SDE28459.1 Endonuclease, Uma2 family (restriction endonuclease fold) [Dyadobacter soli]